MENGEEEEEEEAVVAAQNWGREAGEEVIPRYRWEMMLAHTEVVPLDSNVYEQTQKFLLEQLPRLLSDWTLGQVKQGENGSQISGLQSWQQPSNILNRQLSMWV